ncbi:hypothetical protein [Mesorhizobium sp. B1-1-8]|uniref:hypothetical protein n=1 Tax=Mesorhizobium sp. B1-1-8 TaxID=2589976 RepID=UPI00112EDD9A|nr:hypothetical protein [Mesorhizobium sp. B1-1-8]UCI08407.1 hypothetical protein FJ974_04840 [Mesorhizobium sp. B1-1-8]
MNDFDPTGEVSGKIGRKTDFFRARWRNQVSLDRLFWRDMVLVGTVINIASTVLALVLLGLTLPLGIVLAVHFLPVPYNIFLALAVWRAAEKSGGAKASLMMLGSAFWLIATVVV